MTKRVLFVQGGGEGAHEDDAKLAASLRAELGSDYDVGYPKMPNEDEPDYRTWARIISEELAAMGDGAVLAGHSIGASILIRWLVEDAPAQSIAGLFLIAAPFWHDHDIWRWEEVELPKDARSRLPKDASIFFYHGRDDEIVPAMHVEMYAHAVPQAVVRRLERRNHQLNNDLSEVVADIRRLG